MYTTRLCLAVCDHHDEVGWTLLLDIVFLLGAALFVGILFGRLRQNAIVGYLIAGILLGPAGFSVVKGGEGIEMIAELGVALLLFTIGLEFSWRRLRSLGAVAAGGGALQVASTIALFTGLAVWYGLEAGEALVVGFAIALSSTAVVLRVMADRAELDSQHGRNALGILLFQDIAVVPLVLIVDVLGGGDASLASFAMRIVEGVLFVAGMVLISRFVLPRLLASAASFHSRDLPILLAFTVFLLSTWGSHALGLSPVLGAFIAGMLLAETPFAEQIRTDVTPLRAAFVTIFFTSIGMLVAIPTGSAAWKAVAFALLIILLKTALVMLVVRLFRRPLQDAVRTGLTLAQIGEFSFVLAELAYEGQILSQESFQLLLSASLISLLATPYLIALASRITLGQRSGPGDADQRSARKPRVLVVGIGPAGRAVVNMLDESGHPFLVLELNPDTVASFRSAFPIEYGDATHREILEHAGIGTARALVVTIPDASTARTIIRQAKMLAPKVPVIVRSRHHIHAPVFSDSGADAVVDEEEMVGQQLASCLRDALSDQEELQRKEIESS